MSHTDTPLAMSAKNECIISVKAIIRDIVDSNKHEPERRLIKTIAAELNVSFLDCAAALSYALNSGLVPKSLAANAGVKVNLAPPKIRLVRYRLAVGQQQGATLSEIKKVLVEESGVDVRNIENVRIQDVYTLIDLPDEMPQEVYLHLKTVEINQHKLDIRRVKNRGRMRNNRKYRQTKNSVQPHNLPKDAEK